MTTASIIMLAIASITFVIAAVGFYFTIPWVHRTHKQHKPSK